MAERAVGPRSARLDLASLETLIDPIPDAAVAADDGGRIRSANQLAAELFGFRRDELVGASLDLLVPETLRESHRTQHRR